MNIIDFMTIEELRELLESKEYKYRVAKKVNYSAFEQLRSYGKGIATLFDDLIEDLGRIPTQDEFIRAGLVRCQEFFTDVSKVKNDGSRWFKINGESWFQANWWKDKKLRLACAERLSRTYPSKIVEVATQIQMRDLFPEVEVVINDDLDFILGVDLAVIDVEADKTIYFHISSYNGRNWIKTKALRGGTCIDRNGKKNIFKRDFSKGHEALLYTLEESETTEIINGNPIFKESYLEDMMYICFDMEVLKNVDSAEKPSQIANLVNWVKDILQREIATDMLALI